MVFKRVIAKKASFWEVVDSKQKRISKARFDAILSQKIVKTEKCENETIYHVVELLSFAELPENVQVKQITHKRKDVKMIKCILQGFTITQNAKFVLYSGFSNGKAVLTIENKRGFETIHINVARDMMLNKSVCALNAPDSALNKRHKQHINQFLSKGA